MRGQHLQGGVTMAKIYTYTIIYSSTEDYKDKTPYVAGIVEDAGERRAALIEGYAEGMDVRIGMEVKFSRYDEAGNGIYKFL